MPDVEQAIETVLLDPMESILFHVGRGIAAAQMELDKNSMATQIMIDNDETLSSSGIEATWYHFPETTLELRMVLCMNWEEQKRPGRPTVWKQVLLASPYNASYKSRNEFEAHGTSVIKARIVSLPPAKPIISGEESPGE
jgi:hypothetical protein